MSKSPEKDPLIPAAAGSSKPTLRERVATDRDGDSVVDSGVHVAAVVAGKVGRGLTTFAAGYAVGVVPAERPAMPDDGNLTIVRGTAEVNLRKAQDVLKAAALRKKQEKLDAAAFGDEVEDNDPILDQKSAKLGLGDKLTIAVQAASRAFVPFALAAAGVPNAKTKVTPKNAPAVRDGNSGTIQLVTGHAADQTNAGNGNDGRS